jgi:beta-galactosidase
MAIQHIKTRATKCVVTASLLLAILTLIGDADPLTIDLTKEIPSAGAAPYGPGTKANPQGQELTADQRSFFLDAKPWIPVLGEFHYARVPREEWREDLLKMRAGGINTISTYVFWIHHEEVQGTLDWSGNRSLRDFLKLCQELGLKVMVRMGPWDHGEVRNGGFPDWVQHSGTNLRSKDPAFLNLVQAFFKEEADQMSGLLWKDGGPVIGVQLDNECSNPDYLLALKDLARTVGVDVPFYAITGWQGNLPHDGLIPLFGGYSDGFWGGSLEDYRREYMLTDTRAVNDLGAELTTKNPANNQLIDQFPYACVEIGAGMMSGYDKRIKIDPNSIAALALSKLADGNNMPGYYMYQGGINPDGKLSTLQEDHPNRMPVKDYDFQAPLGLNGEVREHYHLLREQHLFPTSGQPI